ncbi:hypothetical protein [Malacoplasma muris]|uniref:hypothetical protein n=1 Tax=Malacoplasma muris TaxID=2119 RepID=UPI00398E8018
MKSLVKTILIECCLSVLLIAWLIILLISLNKIPVSGFETIQNLFVNTPDNTKQYGAVALFGGVGLAIFYSMLMVFLYFIRTPRKLMYTLNIAFYSLSFSGVVVGLLLIFLNF